jgi:hypothetical protein
VKETGFEVETAGLSVALTGVGFEAIGLAVGVVGKMASKAIPKLRLAV